MTRHTPIVRPSRRSVLRASLGAGALAAAGPALAQPATTRALRKVRMTYGVPTIDSLTAAFFSSIPIGTGFYAEEGLDVEVQPLNGASAAINALVSGASQFSTHSSAALMAGVGRGVDMKSFIVQIPDNFFSLAVLEESPIRSVEELRGKTIGVAALTGAPAILIKSVLRRLGWDVERDVQWLAVGTGAPALDALRRGRIQAAGLWSSVYSLFEFHGAKLRYFRPEPLPSVGFTHTTNVTTELAQREPELVAGAARALAKSLVFMAHANSDELTKLHYKVYPNARPVSMTEQDLMRLQRSVVNGTLQYMRRPQRIDSRAEQLGDETDARINELAKVLAEGGEIPTALPADRYHTRQFVPAMNSINFEAVAAQARAFRA